MIPPGNTDYWTDDTSGETLTTGRMIPPGKHMIPPENTDYWTDDTSGETLTTGRMIPPGNTDYW
jgi:hypothetical protein